MPTSVDHLSWSDLQSELDRLRETGDRDVSAVLRELEIYHEEVERQKWELIEAQRELEDSRDRYLDLFESAPLGYAGLSGTGIIEEINPAGAALLGRRRGVLVGASLFAFVADGEHLAAHLRRLAQGEDPVRDEVWLLRSDGARVPVELFSRASARGSLYRCALTDLTERRRQEEVRRELAVRERVSRESNEAKDRFIAMLSHELRTPLTPLLASVAALEDDEGLPARLRPFVARMRRNVQAEAHLIDDLLDLSRVRRGQMRLDRARVDGHRVVRDALRVLGHDRTRVRLVLDAQHAALWADPVRIEQVLANLLRNAVKATRTGGDVRVETENPVPGTLRISVRDTGVGIEPSRVDLLFSAFESGPMPGRDGGGLGLGLAISRSLVEAHGGRIRAESDGVGKGSCFTVELPLAGPPLAGPALPLGAPPRETKRGEREAAPGFGGRRILLVEDHEDSAAALALLLERQGFTVRIAASVQEALARAEEGFDVLLSDVSLSDGSGHELLEALRARLGTVPAIAVSGFGSAVDAETSRRAGFCEHLTKPVDRARLLDALGRALTVAPGAP